MFLTHFQCSGCGAVHPANSLNQNCSNCGGVLQAFYDYEKARAFLKREDLLTRSPNIWRYKELLPLIDEAHIISKGEGWSPIIQLRRCGAELDLPGLYMKDESTQPCGTFKARACSVTVSANREWGPKPMIVCADSLEGLAWSSYAAAAGLPLAVLTLESELSEKAAQLILATGARLYAFKGDIALAASLAERSAKENGWLHVSSFYEPYRLEGKKTVGFEIAEQFDWKLPEVIVCMVDYSGPLFGIYRALRDMQALGWINRPLPRLVAVQVENDNELFKAWQARRPSMLPPKGPDPKEHKAVDRRLAFINQFGSTILDGLYKTLGCAVSVSRDEVSRAAANLGQKEGVPAGEAMAAIMAATARLRSEGWIKPREKTLLVNPETGIFRMPPIPYPAIQSLTLA
ncbi:threonine synthase, partial [Desulfovibrio sp. OttesenSCG-928-C14]|nr:threonine synthase [Desulfovibrio sp. OttesenSCG-928-C14]